MLNNLLYLLLLTLFAACSNMLSIAGRYASKDSPYEFIMNKDSTFTYKFYQFHEYEYSSGKWQKEGRKNIVLNSVLKNTSVPLEVIGLPDFMDDRLNRFSFEFKSNGISAKDCECAIVINNTTKEIRRCDSLDSVDIKMPVQNIFIEVRKSPLLFTSLRFSLDPLITNKYYTTKEYGNHINFRISVNDSLFSYKIFDKSRLKIKSKGIFFYNYKGSGKHWIPRIS